MNRRWILIVSPILALLIWLAVWIENGNWVDALRSFLMFLFISIFSYLVNRDIMKFKVESFRIKLTFRLFTLIDRLKDSDKTSLPKAFWWVRFSMLIVPSEKTEDFLMGLDERYPTILKRVGKQWGEIVYRKEILFFVTGFLMNRVYKIILAITKLSK